MDLVAAGIIVFALLLASYSTRNTWIALGSGAVSIGVLVGAFILYTAENSGQIRQGFGQLAKQLPSGWDQHAQTLAATIERTSTALAEAKKRATARGPFLAMSISDWFGLAPGTEAEAEPEPQAAQDSPDAPIKWFLDEPPAAASETFLLSGANFSDRSVKVVRAVLKPDSGAGELPLTLHVEGSDGAVIPPGARFRLEAPGLTAEDAKRLGGAILSFAYEQAGRRKSSILYLTPLMLTQDEQRD